MHNRSGACPLSPDSAAGATVTDLDGHRYADFALGDTAAMGGHSPRPTVDAVQRRFGDLGGASTMMPTEDAVRVGDALQRLFGLRYWQVAMTATDANRLAAQSAAVFALIRPTKTFGQKRNGKIVVTRCVVKPTKSRNPGRLVMATYGLTPKAQLVLSQTNSGHACSMTGKATALGTVKVGGGTAKPTGLCGRAGLPPCTATKIFLFLTWIKHHVYYVASSFGESRATLVAFARATKRVR